MRSLELSLDNYDTDKISPNRFLQEEYDRIFEPYVQKKIAPTRTRCIRQGDSLLLWRDYFPFGTIAGIDIKLPDGFDPGERIHIFEGSQADLSIPLAGCKRLLHPKDLTSLSMMLRI